MAQALKDNDYVVLDSAFVTRLDPEGKKVERLAQGQKFTPVKDYHDVDELVRLGVIATVADVKSGEARVLTALRRSQIAAAINGEQSPVISLAATPVVEQSQPETQAEAKKAQAAQPADPPVGAATTTVVTK